MLEELKHGFVERLSVVKDYYKLYFWENHGFLLSLAILLYLLQILLSFILNIALTQFGSTDNHLLDITGYEYLRWLNTNGILENFYSYLWLFGGLLFSCTLPKIQEGVSARSFGSSMSLRVVKPALLLIISMMVVEVTFSWGIVEIASFPIQIWRFFWNQSLLLILCFCLAFISMGHFRNFSFSEIVLNKHEALDIALSLYLLTFVFTLFHWMLFWLNLGVGNLVNDQFVTSIFYSFGLIVLMTKMVFLASICTIPKSAFR